MPTRDPDKLRAKRRRYRERHPGYGRGWSRSRLKEHQSWLDGMREHLACVWCGATEGLHFHHRDPATKSFSVGGSGAHSRSRDSVLSEMQKCEVLCRQCHGRLHAGVLM